MLASCAVEQSDGFGMDSRHYWEENGPAVKYENFNSNDGFNRQGDPTLNFATGALASEDDGDYLGSSYLKKGKVSRQQDPMSHRVIEKRRRDRMNNCLADLSRLIPPEYLKKGRGRVEKTEIIEMAIRRLKYLQDRAHGADESRERSEGPISLENYRLGYQECRAEVMRYLVETQGYLPTDSLCVQLVGHLHRHCDSITKGNQLNHPRSNPETTSSSSGSSGTYVEKSSVIIARAPSADDYKRPYESFSSPDTRDGDCQPAEPPPTSLRGVRKLERDDGADAHYKFKNNIKQRFSQDEARDMSVKRRRKLDSKSGSFNSSHDEGVCGDASPAGADEPRGVPPHLTPEPPPLPTLSQVSAGVPPDSELASLCVPVFALNAAGKYYVPLNVSYDCLSAFLGPYDLLRSASTTTAPLHPVNINVNFQPYLEYLKPKAEAVGRMWKAV